MPFTRRRFLNRSVAALGGVLGAACSLTESRWPGTGSPPRRPPPVALRVLYGPWAGAMYTEVPVDWIELDGRPYTPDREWFHTTVAAAFKERYPESTVSFESHHDPLNRALEPPTTWGKLLDTAYRSTLVSDGELVRSGFPAPHSRWFWWLLQMTGVTLYDGGQVAALENEAEVVLGWLRDLDAAVRPSGVVPLERQSRQEPFSVDSDHWYLGKVAHAWLPDLPPKSKEFLQWHSWELSSPPPREAAPPQQATPSADVRKAMATAEAEQRRAALSGPPPAAAGRPTPESTLIGVPPVPGSTRYALPGVRAVPPLVHAHTAVLHLSTQAAAPDNAWELLTMLLEPETLHSYTHLRWAVPPRKSILDRGHLQSGNTQQMVALWLRYGRPPFAPPRYAAVSQAIEATFQAVVVSKEQAPGDGARKLVAQLEKIAQEITPTYTGTTRR